MKMAYTWWSSLYCFGHNSRHNFDFFFVTLVGCDLVEPLALDVECSFSESIFAVLPFSCWLFSCLVSWSKELLSVQLFCFSADCVDDFDKLSLFRTAFESPPLFLKLLKRGFLSCTGDVCSSCWALWQFSSQTVNSMSPISLALAKQKRVKKRKGEAGWWKKR